MFRQECSFEFLRGCRGGGGWLGAGGTKLGGILNFRYKVNVL